jgi:hypothetical protein
LIVPLAFSKSACAAQIDYLPIIATRNCSEASRVLSSGAVGEAQSKEAALHRLLYIFFLICFAVAGPAQGREALLDWVPYVNERFGFSFRYPVGVFEPDRRAEAGDGEVFTDVGGNARLLVGAFENADGVNVQSYMSFIRRESYSGYDVDYAPRGQTWFVLSGENDQNVFYEKVMFSCSGRIISSFALIYPIARKAMFDPIVEGIEKTFKPANNCGQYARP